MSDLIYRHDAIKAIKTSRFLVDAIEKVMLLPTAQPKAGEWLPDNNNYIYEQYVCSECKNSFKVDTCMGKPMWSFCPNCGTRMLKEGD